MPHSPVSAGVHDRAPRDGVDFEFTGDANTVLPGTHPLPLNSEQVLATRWPLVSPYLPAPGRVHPYFTEAPAELPFFSCSSPIVYNWGLLKERIIAPVFDTKTGGISHTRELDPFVFGCYPDQDTLGLNCHYWMVRNQNYAATWEFQRYEIFRKAKKNWPNMGTGMGRVSDRKDQRYPWGARGNASKPWNMMMPTAQPPMWQLSNRMMLTLKMLQGKLMIVDRLTLENPNKADFLELCARMNWDVRHDGAGVLFVDGGSRLTPSAEFDRAFFYGSFHNGRCKLVRPNLTVDMPYEWNYPVVHQSYRGPRGPKNPVPLNRFNCYDALDHHLLVVTEGAVLQMEQEVEDIKFEQLPPHIANQLVERGYLQVNDNNLHGGSHGGHVASARLQPIEREVAGRVEENEKTRLYEGYYDNPYEPWSDEANASYEVDAVEGFIKRHVSANNSNSGSRNSGVPGSWRQLS